MYRRIACALGALACLAGPPAEAKPIAFAHGTTVMGEYGGDTMRELQVFHAPRYDFSFGAGHLALDSEVDGRSRDITYARANWLAKRWNLENAQGNAFVWGGVGNARVSEDDRSHTTWNAGAQLDYETRRVYASLKTDYFESPIFRHRIDTLQLGVAPYEHEYSGLATWFVVQARQYTGEIHSGTEYAVLLRLFKRGAWVEAGPTSDGKLQAMVMFNF